MSELRESWIRMLDELVEDGPTNAEIGRRLGYATRTVDHGLQEARALAGATNRTQLALWWLRRKGRLS